MRGEEVEVLGESEDAHRQHIMRLHRHDGGSGFQQRLVVLAVQPQLEVTCGFAMYK